ncbi:DUF2271 domain-containing protein [Luteolibacter pohnpeiensis]|uniref:DUF2271 domain-containing protein n=1 Tax=Luteolibacter pohnpeiensis TaxID=454153 RepID=A0A934VXD9_9BACT|nr:DUF2271 domain-containing protein [Luteolibacter pohnpeiensis]MBK1883733.1 DUF2271 domain-containing protein [Luteolibacter pohnpeiensis]
MKPSFLIFAPILATTAFGGEVKLTIEIPQLDAAEYHRPYVAAWIEKPDRSVATDLTVWYDAKNKKGTSWLKDLRQWWRKSGRSAELPIDGVSGPTRPVGKHELDLSDKAAAIAPLPDGEYTLVVEAAREVGGREMVRIPFKWDGKTAVDAADTGKTELGAVKFTIQPEP